MGTEIIRSQDEIRPIFYCSAQNPVASKLHYIKAKALTFLVPSSFFNLSFSSSWATILWASPHLRVFALAIPLPGEFLNMCSFLLSLHSVPADVLPPQKDLS